MFEKCNMRNNRKITRYDQTKKSEIQPQTGRGTTGKN